jgi:hypothetical protein
MLYMFSVSDRGYVSRLNVRKVIRANDHVMANTNNHPLSGLRWASTGRSSPMPDSGGGILDTYVIPTVCVLQCSEPVAIAHAVSDTDGKRHCPWSKGSSRFDDGHFGARRVITSKTCRSPP